MLRLPILAYQVFCLPTFRVYDTDGDKFRNVHLSHYIWYSYAYISIIYFQRRMDPASKHHGSFPTGQIREHFLHLHAAMRFLQCLI